MTIATAEWVGIIASEVVDSCFECAFLEGSHSCGRLRHLSSLAPLVCCILSSAASLRLPSYINL